MPTKDSQASPVRWIASGGGGAGDQPATGTQADGKPQALRHWGAKRDRRELRGSVKGMSGCGSGLGDGWRLLGGDWDMQDMHVEGLVQIGLDQSYDVYYFYESASL